MEQRADGRPGLHELPAVKNKSEDERRHQLLLVKILASHGFEIVQEAVVYGHDKDGQKLRMRPDLMLRHPDMPDMLGAVEVKSSAKSPDAAVWSRRQTVDLIKQASDYVGCRCMATGEVIDWCGIYPVRGFQNVHRATVELTSNQIWLSAAMEIGSKHFKVHPMFHREREGLTIGYLDREVIWDQLNGWRRNVSGKLGGKRQVGGQRL